MKKIQTLFTTMLFINLNLTALSQSEANRVLVISGGGARGAWGGGVAKQFVIDSGRHYKCIVGTSSGSLLAPLVAMENFKDFEQGLKNKNYKIP